MTFVQDTELWECLGGVEIIQNSPCPAAKRQEGRGLFCIGAGGRGGQICVLVRLSRTNDGISCRRIFTVLKSFTEIKKSFQYSEIFLCAGKSFQSRVSISRNRLRGICCTVLVV